jgi:hypothetical protein
LKDATPENVLKIFDALKPDLPGKVAIKVHSGEQGNPNFIRPLFWKPLIDKINGTVVECNTAYKGERHNTELHKKLLEKHEWTKYFTVDIMDENPKEDIEVAIPDGFKIKNNFLGKHIENYNSSLVLIHQKGHPMGGFGGALKQLSIGFASTKGKCHIHSAGVTQLFPDVWNNVASSDDFMDSMADAAKSVIDYFKGKLAYISVMKNISIDCDCCANAALPEIPDMGIFASLDPVAIDQAFIDKIKSCEGKGKEAFMKRVKDKHGLRVIEMAEKHGLGTRNYEIINLD